MTDKMPIDIHRYWDERLASNLNLRGTGHRAFSLEYNHYLYQAQTDCLTKLLEKNKIDLSDKRILDIGSGTGFFVDYYLKRGAEKITGLDISETSVNYLSKVFTGCLFFVEDISNTSLDYLGSFDFVSVISMIYHIVDDNLFKKAVNNLCMLCKSRGYLLISDAFMGRWFLNAGHAHLRSLDEYRPYLEEFEIVDIMPIYYLLNHTFIPFIGPKIIEVLNLGNLFYRIDNHLRGKRWNNCSGMKFILLQKAR